MPELDLVSKGMTTCQGCAMELIARSALEVLGPKTITMTPAMRPAGASPACRPF